MSATEGVVTAVTAISHILRTSDIGGKFPKFEGEVPPKKGCPDKILVVRKLLILILVHNGERETARCAGALVYSASAARRRATQMERDESVTAGRQRLAGT